MIVNLLAAIGAFSLSVSVCVVTVLALGLWKDRKEMIRRDQEDEQRRRDAEVLARAAFEARWDEMQRRRKAIADLISETQTRR